jgi:hypothetical protein
MVTDVDRQVSSSSVQVPLVTDAHFTLTADIQVYKLIDAPEEAVTAVVTEADLGTIAIMSTLTKLENQVTEITEQILA